MSTEAPFNDEARARVASIARKRGLDLVVLFGSRAHGVTHAESDTDLAVCRPDDPLSFDALLDAGAELGSALATEVDLVDLRCADPLLLHQIFRRAVVLYAEADAFERERLRAFHRYQDYRPFLALERAAVRRMLKRHAGRP